MRKKKENLENEEKKGKEKSRNMLRKARESTTRQKE